MPRKTTQVRTNSKAPPEAGFGGEGVAAAQGTAKKFAGLPRLKN